MKAKHGFFTSLKCRECGRHYPKEALHVCEFCFGPLEVDYDYGLIKTVLTRAKIASRPTNMWRYRELLPIEGEPTIGFQVGFTPLVRANRLAKRLGLREVWIKNDTVNYPTLSFKDRVVSVALSRARELGFEIVACASTGNLANSVAANAASGGLKSYVFIPADLETGKVLGSLVYGTNVIGIRGTYDQVNRLCSEIAGKYGWAFVNVNIRPYYAEGSKAMGYEIIEQLGWRLPDHVVVPMAGGLAHHEDPQVLQRVCETGPGGRASMFHSWGPGRRVRADCERDEGRGGHHQAGEQTANDREIAGDRQPGGRVLLDPDDETDGRLGGESQRRGGRGGNPVTGGNGRDFCGDRGGHDRRGDPAVGGGGPDQAGRIAGVVHYGPWAEDAGSGERQVWRGAGHRAASARVFGLVGQVELIRRRRNELCR